MAFDVQTRNCMVCSWFCCRCNFIMKPPFYIRMVILLCVGGFGPVLITTILNQYFGYSIQRSMELTFILCLPLAAWMAHKINERWHDDRED